MNKNFFACAALSMCAATASAQSNVLVYGSIDAGLRYLSNVDAAGNSRLSMGSNGNNYANRLGFKGTEDLGDEMNAHFMLESGFNTGSGALDNTTGVLFNRAAYVGLGSRYGTVDVGRQYNVVFKAMAPNDPTRLRYAYITLTNPAAAGVRTSNDVQYTAVFNGITARAEYAPGEVAGNARDGATRAVALSYGKDGWYAAGTHTRKRNLGLAGNYYDYRHSAFGASYSAGPVRLSGGYADERQATAGADTTNRYAWLGANYMALPTTELTAAYYVIDNSTAQLAGKRAVALVSATYFLSKRSNLYAAVDKSTYHGGLVPATKQTRQTGMSVGVMQMF